MVSSVGKEDEHVYAFSNTEYEYACRIRDLF